MKEIVIYTLDRRQGVLMNTIITIGRQFGSAGREIGEKVAEYFGIKCYDKELLTRAAQESGFCEEMIQNHDERPTNSFLYNLECICIYEKSLYRLPFIYFFLLFAMRQR